MGVMDLAGLAEFQASSREFSSCATLKAAAATSTMTSFFGSRSMISALISSTDLDGFCKPNFDSGALCSVDFEKFRRQHFSVGLRHVIFGSDGARRLPFPVGLSPIMYFRRSPSVVVGCVVGRP